MTNTLSSSISELFTIPDVADADSPARVAVPFSTERPDGDRVDDTVTFEVTYATGDMRGDAALEEPFQLTVIDQHKLPYVSLDGITIDDDVVLSLMESQTGTLTLEADRDKESDGTASDDVTTEAITITLSRADTSTADSSTDYRLGSSTVSIGASANTGTGTVTVEVLPNDDVGEEVLTLVGLVEGDSDENDTGRNGSSTAKTTYEVMFDIIFVDNTTKKIQPKSPDDIDRAVMTARIAGAGDNGLWTPVETMTLEASDLFTWPTTTTSIGLSNAISEDQQIADAKTSNDSLLDHGDGRRDDRESASPGPWSASRPGATISQTVSNVATVKFYVTVDPPAIIAKDNVQAVAERGRRGGGGDGPERELGAGRRHRDDCP